MKSSEVEPIIVLDIGGTNYRSSIFENDKGLILPPKRSTTPNYLNNKNIPMDQLQNILVENLFSTVEMYQKQFPQANTVGVSFPAPITNEGVVKQASTLWGDKGKNFPLLAQLTRNRPHVNWEIANDISAAAERYAALSQYQHIDYFAVITVSSGIGGKIYDVKHKSVILDSRGIGGEMGHVQFDFSNNAPICECGGQGHLGALASGRAVEKLAILEAQHDPERYLKSLVHEFAKRPEEITTALIVQAIHKEDKFACDVLDRTTTYLARAIAQISGNIGADKYIIIGGFALNCGEPYLRSLKNNLQKLDFYGRTYEEILGLVDFGINDDNDCLIGIGKLAHQRYVAKL